jgi:putative nucleotidyltransferase with HDIG domain
MLARKIGLEEAETGNIYYSALLHDIGICDEYITRNVPIDMDRHCIIGSGMLKKLPLPDIISTYVLYHHEYINGRGPLGLSGEAIPIGSLIICMASAFDDVFGKETEFNQNLVIKIKTWLENKKDLFPVELVDAFSDLINIESFLLDYFNHETKYVLSHKFFLSDGVHYDSDDIKKYALCFAGIIDQRSPFTFKHSTGIAELSEKIAYHLGYDEKTQSKMYIAGLLHDIGKLHVSTDILHKNGKLSPEERFEINKHTYYTRNILEQIQGFEEIINIAANHHEKLNGQGYPNHLYDEHLSEPEKVLAICDVFQALSEERPYREMLPPEKVWQIIDEMAENKHLDKSLIEKIKKITFS